MTTQAEKAQAFAALHERPRCFVLPNPWDAPPPPLPAFATINMLINGETS